MKLRECATVLREVGDVQALLAECVEHGAGAVLLTADRMDPAFFDLRTGIAGELLQKLQNYGIRGAGVVEEPPSGRFAELARELDRGNRFRFFRTRAEAESWLADG